MSPRTVLLLSCLLWGCILASADAATRSPWFLNAGKGYVLCETMLRIANRNPHRIGYLGMGSSIPWSQVFLIKGISEPPWEELNPAEHKSVFLKIRQYYEPVLKNHAMTGFDAWYVFSQQYGTQYKIELSDAARLALALESYRFFVQNEGRMKIYRFDMGEFGYPYPVALVQYERGHLDQEKWRGFTAIFEPDLSDIKGKATGYNYEQNKFGPDQRLLFFHGVPFLFGPDADEYHVKRLRPEMWQCEIWPIGRASN